MIQRLIPSGVAAAIAGGTMAVALSCCPSFAADVQQVYHHGHAYHHPYHYDHYNNSYRVRHYVPKTNPYHNAYHHPYHYDHYSNSHHVRHYVPKTNPYHNY